VIELKEHIVAMVGEIPTGNRKIVQIEGRSIGVFNVDGEFYALRNVCPHQGAPLCKGSVGGMHICGDDLYDVQLIKEGEILRCPWHGWEFDIKTGTSITDPQKLFVKNYKVTVQSKQSEMPQVETYSTTVQSNYVVVRV
jgi:nitrite reductase (NADH) small subunit